MPQTVLIADDSLPLHKLVKTQLEPDSLTFHSVYDGEAAIAIAASLRPDLILLDVNMPRLDGFEVCRSLKANSLTASIPLIFLTADSVLLDKVKGLNLGAVDYIVKPFKPEELRARVRAALRSMHMLDETRMVDGMTGLWNQTYFNLRLKSQLSLAQRAGRPLSCIVADIDHRSVLISQFGLAAANEIMRNVGRILLGKCRAEDVVCRFGEGQFAMLVAGTNRGSAARMAERLRSEIERQLQARSTLPTEVTCSFGVADTAIAQEALVELAEVAVYKAKQKGRNSVSIAREPGNPITSAA